MSAWKAYLAVGGGSALGSVLRYDVSLVTQALFGTYFPWATLLVNVLGSCFIGWLAATISRSPHGQLARYQPLLVGGFCGGFTTFSLFSLETLHLIHAGHAWLAFVYVLVSLPLWLGAVLVGERMALSR